MAAKKKKKATRKTATKKKVKGRATAKKTTRKAAAKKTTGKARAKATKKKATAKTTAKRKTTTAKATVTAASPRRAAVELKVRTNGFEKVAKTRTKSQVLSELSESTGLSKKEVSNVFENLTALMSHDLTKGPGTFQVPGLLKVVVVRKKAVAARKGTNPFTGEEMMFKAKPARNVVRARPLKGLKDLVGKGR